jgi:RHS repeat-associated protein
MGLLTVMLGTAMPLLSQSYATSFEEPRYDRARTPATFHGGLSIDSPTGAASMQVPIGPGFGARGIGYRPVLNLRWAPQADILPQEGVPGILNYTTPGSDLTPGGLTFAASTWGHFVTNYQLPDASTGVAGGRVPSTPGPDIPAILHAFGYGADTVPASVSILNTAMPSLPPTVTPMMAVSNSGALILGLQNGANPVKLAYYDGVGDPAYNAVTVPTLVLIVQGEVGYEFMYYANASVAAVYRKGPGVVVPISHSAPYYRLTRVLNRFGESIDFSYGAYSPVGSQTGPQGTYLAGSYTATWKQGGVPAGPSVTVAASASAIHVTYGGLASSNPSYTIGLTGAAGVQPPASSVWSPWQDLGVGSVTQDLTQETMAFTYGPGPVIPAASGATGGGVAPTVLTGITLPSRSIALSWNSYAYARQRPTSTDDWAGYAPSNMYSWFFGVAGISDTSDGQTRTTTHTRVVPNLVNGDWTIMAYTWGAAWLPNQAFYDCVQNPDQSFIVYKFAMPALAPFQSSAGSYAAQGNPSLNAPSAEQIQTLLFMKHQVVEERHYLPTDGWQSDLGTDAASSIAYLRIRRGGWAINRVGNPNGGMTNGTVAYPTQTEVWKTTESVTAYTLDQLTGSFDTANCGWTGRAVTSQLNGAPQALRNHAMTPSFNATQWFPPHNTREQLLPQADSTPGLAPALVGQALPALPAAYKAFDPSLNVLNSAQVGESAGPNITTTFSYGSSGLDQALPQAVALSVSEAQAAFPVGIAAYGHTGSADGVPQGYLKSILPYGATWPASAAANQSVDAYGRPLAQTDINGNQMSFAYDAAGRLVSVSRSGESQAQTISYDDASHRGVTISRGAQSIQFRYNGFGELVMERRFDGTAWSNRMHGYDTMGRQVVSTVWKSGLGDDTQWANVNLDTAATVTTTTPGYTICTLRNVDGDCTRWRTVPPSTTTTTVPPLYQGGTNTVYDPYGRVVSVTNPDGDTVTTGYAGLDSTQSVAAIVKGVPKVVSTTLTKDVLGRLVRVVDGKGQTTRYYYDQADRIVEVDQADPATGATQKRFWVYNTLGRVIALDQPESGVTYYADFTVAGKARTVVYGLPRGWRPASVDAKDATAASAPGVKVLAMSFDQLGRVLAVSSADGTVNQSFAYDAGGLSANANGKMTSDVDAGPYGTIARTHKYAGPHGRESELDTAIPGLASPLAQTFTYDSAYGSETGSTTPHGVLALTLNPATGLPTAAQWNGTPVVSSATYDPVTWNLLGLSYGNGAFSSFGYRPDQVGLASMNHYEQGNTTARFAWAYQYDHAGNLLTDGEDSYQYDELGRLTQAAVRRYDLAQGTVTQAFDYDAFGNQVMSLASGDVAGIPGGGLNNFSFSAAEKITMGATNRIPGTANGVPTGASYDAQGNLAQIYQQATSGTPKALSMAYDALGRVVSLSNSATNQTECYAYTSEGLRTVVKVYGGAGVQSVRVNLYDDARRLVWQGAQSGPAVAWTRDLVYMGMREAAEFDAGGMHVTHEDHLGSPRMMTNGSGKLEATQKYLPFGEALDQAGSFQTGKGFTGHEQTDVSGLIYMQGRHYAPMYHRFLSPDPARDQHFDQTQSWNIYSYVQNDPVMKVDPTGMVVGYGFSGGDLCPSRGGDVSESWYKNTEYYGEVADGEDPDGVESNAKGEQEKAQASDIGPGAFDSSSGGRQPGGPNLGDPAGGGSYWNTSVHTEDKKETTDEGATHRVNATDIDRNLSFLKGGDLLNFSSSQRYASEVTSIGGEKSWFGGTLFAAGSAEHVKGQLASDGTAKIGSSGIGVGGSVTLGGPGLDAGGRLGFRIGGYKISVVGGNVGVGLTGGAKASVFSTTDKGFKLISIHAILGLKVNLDLINVERAQ